MLRAITRSLLATTSLAVKPMVLTCILAQRNLCLTCIQVMELQSTIASLSEQLGAAQDTISTLKAQLDDRDSTIAQVGAYPRGSKSSRAVVSGRF